MCNVLYDFYTSELTQICVERILLGINHNMTTNRLNVDVFALISNIPNSFHSQDLRNYFSQFVEERRFKCFHFRNRPEQRLSKPVVKSTECGEVDNARPNAKSREDHVTANCRPDEESPRHSTDIPHASISSSGNSSRLNEVNGRPNSASTSDFKSNRKCCVIKIANINLKTALKLYHKKPWVDRSGNAMGIRCFIVGIKTWSSSTGAGKLICAGWNVNDHIGHTCTHKKGDQVEPYVKS